MSSYLGRPSTGDSPFATADRALHDTSSPQPPSQRNPTPRKHTPSASGTPSEQGSNGGVGFMNVPSPYGSVSDEARRRYEERYAKKRAEDEAKREQERREQEQKERDEAQKAQQGHGGPGGYGAAQVPQQQYFDAPPRPQFQGRPGSQGGPSGPMGPRPSPGGMGYGSPPMGQMGRSPPMNQQSFQQQQQQHPPFQQKQQLQPPFQQQSHPPPNQQQQRWSGSQGHQGPPSQGHGGSSQGHGHGLSPGAAGGPQWSPNAVPPPSQQWKGPQSPPLQGQQQQQQQQHPTPPQNPQMAAQQPPKKADDADLQNLFSQFDSSRSGQLNSYDLQRLLAKDATMEAREDCVKMLMNIFDTDRSGSINFMEFEGLYRYIQDWHGIFLRFDRDGSGLIDRKELHSALLGFGFSLPLDMVRKLEKRFAPPPKPGHPPRKGISFDRFLMACVTVKHYTEAFRRADSRNEGRISLDYNSFMDIIFDAPS